MNLPIFVIIPLGAAFLISLVGKRVKYLADILANLGTLGLFIFSLYSIANVSIGGIVSIWRVPGKSAGQRDRALSAGYAPAEAKDWSCSKYDLVPTM